MSNNNNTTTDRKLRSNSQHDLTLVNIKNLIDTSKNEIISSLKAEMQSLRESINSLSTRVDELEEENKLLKQSLQGIPDRPSIDLVTFGGACSDLADELQQRERRKPCLVVVGVPEPASGSVDERKASDKERCHELFEAIGMSSCDIKDVSRVGRVNAGKRRLMRVTVDSEESKWLIISNSKHLRHIEKYKSIYVKPDLTPFQRKLDFELRKELNQRRSTRPDKDFVIHKGKIVERNSIRGFQKEF